MDDKVREALDKIFSLYDTEFGKKPQTALRVSLSFDEIDECKQVLYEAINKLEQLERV
jgi:hypothetical protein